MLAKQNTVSDVGLAAVSPIGDVVHFTSGRRLGAVEEETSAVSDRDHQPLTGDEEPLCAAEVEDLSFAVELDTDESGVAEVSINGLAGNRVGVTLEVAMTARLAKAGFGHDDSHSGSVGAEQGTGVNVDG